MRMCTVMQVPWLVLICAFQPPPCVLPCRLRRNVPLKGGLCGITTAASYPIKTHPNHPVPQVMHAAPAVAWVVRLVACPITPS